MKRDNYDINSESQSQHIFHDTESDYIYENMRKNTRPNLTGGWASLDRDK